MRASRNTRAALAGVALLSATCGAPPDGALTLAPRGEQPRVAVHADGTVAVAYADGETILCRVSRDGGRSYGEAATVATVPGLMAGMGRGPQVAVTGAGIVVSAIGRAGDLLSWRSADRGRLWTGPVAVSRRGVAGEGLHDLAAGAGEVLHAVWLEPGNGGTVLAVARSEDGRSFAESRVLYRSPSGSVCECCQPTVAADGRGGVAVLWRNSLHGARDMYLATSNDEGRSFGEARKLGLGTWNLDGCPMAGGGVAESQGQVATVWRRADEIYTTVLARRPQSDGAPGGAPELTVGAPQAAETLIGPGRHPAVAFGPRGVYLAWQTKGGIRLRTPGAPADEGVGSGSFPDLAAAEAGPAVLVWEGSGGRVLARVVAADGERGPRRTAGVVSPQP